MVYVQRNNRRKLLFREIIYRWSLGDRLPATKPGIGDGGRAVESVKDTLDMIADGRLKPDRMQTHTLPFSKVKEGFEMVANYADGVMKAMIRF